jgi:hypothetical protein
LRGGAVVEVVVELLSRYSNRSDLLDPLVDVRRGIKEVRASHLSLADHLCNRLSFIAVLGRLRQNGAKIGIEATRSSVNQVNRSNERYRDRLSGNDVLATGIKS